MYNFSKLQSEAACKNSVSRTQVDNSTTMKTLTKKSNDRNLPTNLNKIDAVYESLAKLMMKIYGVCVQTPVLVAMMIYGTDHP